MRPSCQDKSPWSSLRLGVETDYSFRADRARVKQNQRQEEIFLETDSPSKEKEEKNGISVKQSWNNGEGELGTFETWQTFDRSGPASNWTVR